MKKQVLIATGLALLATSANATRSRMTALGQDDAKGSLYIEDSRGIFLNPAMVNTMNNYVVTEWGTADATPNAEGGFFRNTGSFSYGAYLNSSVNEQEVIRTQSTAGGYASTTTGAMGNANFVGRDNQIDLFIAGDMGFQWGVRLDYAAGNNESGTPAVKAEQSSMGLGLGVTFGAINGYANMTIKDENTGAVGAANANDKWEASGLNLGASYGMGSYTFFVDYDSVGAEYTADATAKNETSQDTITVGVGRIHEVSSTSRMFMDLAYSSVKAEDKNGTTTTLNTEVTTSSLPLTIGFEADANSWLTLRGSIRQLVIINSQETKVSSATPTTTKISQTDTTSVNAGATLNFGKLKVDGMIGSAGGGVLQLDNLMTNVAVHYWF